MLLPMVRIAIRRKPMSCGVMWERSSLTRLAILIVTFDVIAGIFIFGIAAIFVLEGVVARSVFSKHGKPSATERFQETRAAAFGCEDVDRLRERLGWAVAEERPSGFAGHD